jgi:hypothetical protein
MLEIQAQAETLSKKQHKQVKQIMKNQINTIAEEDRSEGEEGTERHGTSD